MHLIARYFYLVSESEMTQWWNVPKNVIFLLSQFHKYTLLTTNTADLPVLSSVGIDDAVNE